jgi:glycosyltransferase involved in cell wall biosynthesis
MICIATGKCIESNFQEFVLGKDKINLAVLWAKYDGGVTSVNDLVIGLDKDRFNTIFIYLTGYGTEKNAIEQAGNKVFYLSNIELLKAFRFSILLKLVKILKEHNIDIIHCHAHKPTVYGTIAATLAKTPVILAHVHGIGRTDNFKRKLTNFLIFKKIDRLISVAHAVKNDVLKNNWLVSVDKLSVLDNSIEYRQFADISITKKEAKCMLGLPTDAFVLGTVARLSPNKGQIYLIKAFEKVKLTVPSAHLIFAGDGRIRHQLEKEAKETGLSDSIHFLGQRSDIEQVYKAMDTFVLPSIGSEGMPRAILEAMASGIPCIGTNIGGTPEVLGDNEFGYVVQPKDSDGLARAMVALTKMPEQKIAELIKKAKNRVEKAYAHDVMRARLNNIYETEYASKMKK